MHVDLPNGEWLELRDPEDVTERARRKVSNIIGRLTPATRKLVSTPADPNQPADERDANVMATITETDLETFDSLNDLLAEALIEKWSLSIPVEAAAMPDLPSKMYRAVQAAVAPYIGQVMAPLDTTTISRDPQSPT